MSPTPRISVVIPTYNQAAFLRECLESLRAQTLTDWEAVVVNNYSADDTEAVVAAFNDPRIVLINFHNQGVIAASRNLGIARSRAEWIAFLDSDDRWRPQKLEKCLNLAAPGVAVIGHDLDMVRDGTLVKRLRSGPESRASHRSLLFDGSCLTPSAALVRRDWVERVGGFSERPEYRTAEDYEFWLRLALAGAKFSFLSETLTDYRLHEANASASVLVHMQATLHIVEDHFRMLEPKSPLDRLRLRRRRAFVLHGASRRSLAGGSIGDALSYALRAVATWPLLPRAWVNLGLSWARGLTPWEILLWLWVFGAGAAYLWQFREMVPSLLRLLGLM